MRLPIMWANTKPSRMIAGDAPSPTSCRRPSGRTRSATARAVSAGCTVGLHRRVRRRAAVDRLCHSCLPDVPRNACAAALVPLCRLADPSPGVSEGAESCSQSVGVHSRSRPASPAHRGVVDVTSRHTRRAARERLGIPPGQGRAARQRRALASPRAARSFPASSATTTPSCRSSRTRCSPATT